VCNNTVRIVAILHFHPIYLRRGYRGKGTGATRVWDANASSTAGLPHNWKQRWLLWMDGNFRRTPLAVQHRRATRLNLN